MIPLQVVLKKISQNYPHIIFSFTQYKLKIWTGKMLKPIIKTHTHTHIYFLPLPPTCHFENKLQIWLGKKKTPTELYFIVISFLSYESGLKLGGSIEQTQ